MSIKTVELDGVIIQEALNFDDCACVEVNDKDLGYVSHDELFTLRDAITEYLNKIEETDGE